jgi:gliding motility-associated-like protein
MYCKNALRCLGIWLITAILFPNHKLKAQTIDYSDIFWLYGQSTYGITFRKSDFAAELDSIQNPSFGIGGSAVATDPITGDLLFYSDGDVVYDRSHQLIANYSAGLNGNTSANQPVVVSPLPGQNDQYVLIANSASFAGGGSIFEARIDMTVQGNAPNPQDPPYGQMLSPVNTGLTNNASEGMVVIGNAIGTQFWLITHERNTATFLVTPIINTGLDAGSLTSYNFSANGMPDLLAANLSWSQTAGKLAVSPQDTAKNVHLLDFSIATGTLAYDTPVLNSATFDPDAAPGDVYSIYDTEWSPDGTKLYISKHGDNGVSGMVYQYDLNNPGGTLQPILPDSVYRSYGLQKGPDQNIYHLYRATNGGAFQLGQISDADSLSNLVVYQPDYFGNINFNGRQFPATAPYKLPEFDTFGFEVLGTCFGTTTKFYPTIEPQATSYLWDFGDGSQSNLISPVHEYDQPGPYTVTLRATLNGRDSIIVNQVLILESDTLVLRSESGSELPTDTVICVDETLLLDASQPPAVDYRWSIPGHIDPTYTVDTTGYYWVVGTYNTPTGTCTSYDAINVTEYGVQIQVYNKWYFGFEAGIDFNEQPPVALLDGVMNAPEGCTAVSDRNGEILFYTDGETVYGRTGEILGQFIGGDQTATMSVIAVPFPQDETMYYIFTTREVYNGDDDFFLSYAILDIKEITGADPGEVMLDNLPLFERSTERITALGGYGNNAVVVAHEYGNNTFRLYPITANGINPPILQSIGSIHNLGQEESAEGYMKFSQDGTKLAVALSSNGQNIVDLFDYADSTFTLSNHMVINFDELFPEYQVYGVEFSPQGNKLYVSLTGATSRIYELRLDSADINFINQTKNLLREENQAFGALQLGPDGQIYVAIDGSGTLATILPNEIPDQPSSFNPIGIDLQGRISGLGLPNFIQTVGTDVGGPTATVTGLCVGQETQFAGTATSIIDNYEWSVTKVGDSVRLFFDTNIATTYTFLESGDYNVDFYIYNRCGLDTTISQVVTVLDPPPPTSLPEVFAICTGSEVLEAYPAGTTGYTYLWNDGTTERTFPVTEPGIFSVTVSYENIDINGCTTSDTTFVADGRPEYDLGPDFTVCQDESIPDLQTGLNPTSYFFRWRINGVLSPDTTNTQPVDTSVPGNFVYTVNVQDNLTTCFLEDTVNITVNPIPDLAYTINNSTCGNANGEVIINNQPPNTQITLTDASGLPVTLDNRPAGSYTLTVLDEISGCVQIYTLNIIDTDSPVTTTPNPVDGCEFGDIEVLLAGEIYPVDYNLIDVSTGTIVDSRQILGDEFPADPNRTFEILNVDFGEYDLEIISGGCTSIEAGILVNKLPTAGLDIQPDFVNCQTVVVVEPDPNNLYPGQTYVWNGPNVTELVAPVLSVSGSGTYTVRAEGAGLCDTTATFNVTLFENPDIQIDIAGDGCGESVQLTAAIANPEPGNNYSYLWSDGTIGAVNVLPAPTTGEFADYQNLSVEVVNQQNGCQGNDGPIDVRTYQDYDVFLTSSIACDDGSPITINANILNISSSNIDTYDWTGPEPGIGGLNTQAIVVNEEGAYQVITAWGVCLETADLNVARSPVTPSDIEPLYQICSEPPANETVFLVPGNFVSYTLMNVTTGQMQIEIQPGVYELFDEGIYGGTGINSFGCETTDTFAVQVLCLPVVYAPTAFSPASSIPKNRSFSIDGAYIGDNFQIIIFNRWGEPVFESQDKNFEWDGTRKGEILPNGTYAYVMRYTSITSDDPTIYEKRGGVTLIR